METVGQVIRAATLKAQEERLAKLMQIGAPDIMIKSMMESVNSLMQGEFECGGRTELLDEPYESVKEKRGRGGVPYYEFNGTINYFPKAKYGRFITRKETNDD